MLVELLVRIALPVVQVALVVLVTKVLAKAKILLKVVKDLCYTGVGSERWTCHVLSS
jgi:hypothetical protein